MRVEGQVPLVVTFTHAGVESLAGVDGNRADAPSDSGGCGYNTSSNDARTREVAEALLEHLEWAGLRPYVIVPEVSRRDLDLNRSWGHNRAGYEGGGVGEDVVNAAAMIYDGFFDTVLSALSDAAARFPAGEAARLWLVDVHGVGLPPEIDIELGTRNHRSAGAEVVYAIASDGRSFQEALARHDFAMRPDAATDEKRGGCEVMRRIGLEGAGFHAVQVELSRVLRGSGVPAGDEVPTARRTGARLGRAIGDFLKQNDYPVIAEPVGVMADEDCYIVLH
jgi:hypothetical protein